MLHSRSSFSYLIQRFHEGDQRDLELGRDGEWLFASFDGGLVVGEILAGGERFHRLQVLQALLRSFPGPKGFVFPFGVHGGGGGKESNDIGLKC